MIAKYQIECPFNYSNVFIIHYIRSWIRWIPDSESCLPPVGHSHCFSGLFLSLPRSLNHTDPFSGNVKKTWAVDIAWGTQTLGSCVLTCTEKHPTNPKFKVLKTILELWFLLQGLTFIIRLLLFISVEPFTPTLRCSFSSGKAWARVDRDVLVFRVSCCSSECKIRVLCELEREQDGHMVVLGWRGM